MKNLVLVALVVAPACTTDRDLAEVEQAVIPGYLDTALTCGVAGPAGNLGAGNQLQRFDLATFPNARCNDDSPGVFFVRPAASPAGANKWIIQLQGGGGCRTADDCAARWCSRGTNFGMRQMTSDDEPAAINGDGILYRGPQQVTPFEDANHVLIHYCSSDTWAGRSGRQTEIATDPLGNQVSYSIKFRGADIIDAVFDTLRQNGVPGITYTLNDSNVAMPDLDAASHVVFAGASAGGGGIINNGDRIQALLQTNDLDGVLDYRLLIDSTFGPDPGALDWNFSPLCTQAVCDWDDIFLANSMLYARHGDTSCDTWHAANDVSTAWRCDDTDHVIRHHVLAPMMVRMGLLDELLSKNLIDANVLDAAGNVMTLPLFASLVRTELLALPQVAVAGGSEETAPVVPAIYGPHCAKHETLSNNPATFNVRTGPTGARMFEVWNRWVAGAAGSQIVFAPGDPQVCN
jgi:hypothetical protein